MGKLLLEQYTLQPILLEDATLLFQTINNNRAYLSEWLTFIPFNETVDDSFNFIQSVIQHPNFQNQPVYTIKDKHALIGLIGFKDTDEINKSAELGYWLSERYQKKSIMTAALTQIIKYGFEKLGLHRLQLKIAVGNSSSKKLALRLGFLYEGKLREAEKVSANVFRDLEIFSLLHEDRNNNNS